MFTFHQKLKNLKVGLAKWSKDIYGNILQKIPTLEEIIQAQAIQFEGKPTQVNRTNLHKSQADLANYLHLEEEYWRQKSGMKWFTDGERNTNSFIPMFKGEGEGCKLLEFKM